MPNNAKFRNRPPMLELEHSRMPALGYESAEKSGLIRCLSHGFPTSLARWHYHDEYELHLIVASSGKTFVGDYIGSFQPGHLVLTGPRLPHNWVTLDPPAEGIALRDLVIQFPHTPLERAAEHVPELAELKPLLQRAKHGIEFFEMSSVVEKYWHRIKDSQTIARFGIFCEMMGELSQCSSYRLLSLVPMRSADNHHQLDQIDSVLSKITENFSEEVSAIDFARELNMSGTQFSRFFRRATGNTFTDFLNQIRVNRACQLLSTSDRQITQICYEVGFNNVANFNRRFLEVKGMTPRAYRQQVEQRFGVAPLF
jgi:AraC-like DNA-binding protein